MTDAPMTQREMDNQRTREILAGMMKENTGRALCDSGGAYGRGWERNQAIKDFDAIPEITVEFEVYRDSDWFINRTWNTYHFLNERVTATEDSERLQDMFDAYEKDERFERRGWLDTFETWIKEMGFSSEFGWCNSYNDEYSDLSQIIQICDFEDKDGNGYVAVQIHGGCDVRGGYTAPHIFEGDIYELLSSDLSCRVECECVEYSLYEGRFHFDAVKLPKEQTKLMEGHDYPSRGAPDFWVGIPEEGALKGRVHCKRCNTDVKAW